MAGKKFNPDNDIPDLSGKVIFITGGTAGLGKESIQALAAHNPSHIYFTGRSTSRATALIDSLRTQHPTAPITFLNCDLSSLSSVVETAKAFLAQSQRLDVLICNAGIWALTPGLTTDGYEIQFGTNHVAHALLIKLLLPTLLRTAEEPNSDVRIVSLTSAAFAAHPVGGIRFHDIKTPQDKGFFGMWTRYGQSKLANLLYAAELARRYPSITTLAIHPGVVKTDMVNSLGYLDKILLHFAQLGRPVSPEEGAWNQLWAATGAREEMRSGVYYVPVGAKGMLVRNGGDEKLAGELWEWTEEELKGYEA
ncbi:hypothetical protein FGG08_001125 [Glutinoglossum americanum]|uniref:Oxidoreductase n=1 Tax=Glutinoglossum americanum TaxID=1670608 RepID=A0A9P8IC43_9PEZI|nr:hypothetical protein FGG08_001125 [Glutinoglossum americanum]